jgi:uncharacterized protein involved in tolerance to divalent cations
MQYFGIIESKYEEVFLTSSYLYFNYDDEVVTAKDIKNMIKTTKDRKKNIEGTIFIYNPVVTPVGYDSEKFLLDQDFEDFGDYVELKCETYITIFKHAIGNRLKGKLVEIKNLFNLIEKNINSSTLLTKFDQDLERYYTGQNTDFDRDLMYLDANYIVPAGKFSFFCWGDKISQKEFTFIRTYSNTIFNRIEDMGKKVAFVYKRERGLQNAKDLLQFSNPVENYKYKNGITNAIKEAFKEFPPTPKPYE